MQINKAGGEHLTIGHYISISRTVFFVIYVKGIFRVQHKLSSINNTVVYSCRLWTRTAAPLCFYITSSLISYLTTLQQIVVSHFSMLISGSWSNEAAEWTRLYIDVKSLALWENVWYSAGCNAYITSALRFIYYEGPLCRPTCSGLWKRQLLKGARLLLLQKSCWEQWLGGRSQS